MSAAVTPRPRLGAAPRDPLQVMLAEVWQTVLGRGPVGVDRTFAQLGGTPDQLAQMVEGVTGACGRAVPMSLRHPGVTVQELSAALRGPETTSGRTSRVYVARNVGPDATRRPLFFLHGDYGGGGLYCLQLAVHLGRDQPLYAIAPHGLDGEPLPPSIAAMAAERIETVRALQGAGPYRLGGHCNGAVVAFEMARQLVARGERVERLVLVAPVLFPPPAPRPPDSVAQALRRLVGLPARELSAAVVAGIGRRLRRLGRRDSPARARDGGPRTAAAEAWAKLHAEYARLLRAYWPAPYPGMVTVLQPRGDAHDPESDPARIWPRLAARVAIGAIPGEHLSCITVHVRDLALGIRACLDDPDAPAGGTRSLQADRGDAPASITTRP